MDKPAIIKDKKYRFDAFDNNEVLCGTQKGRLPAMGWNSWNAFGSGNTEELTKAMADKFIELGLDKLGYEYLVLDDGCYSKRGDDNTLLNEKEKFPSGFKALADYIHAKGLKFGMYNDVGVKLCSGLEVGTCGYEALDVKSYLEWNIDFIKVDNCYYLWDNATFSDAENAKYTYAPNIKSITLKNEKYDVCITLSAVAEGILAGSGAWKQDDYVTGIGTYDGTGPEVSPIGDLSSELQFEPEVEEAGNYELTVEYEAGVQINKGSWLQIAVGTKEKTQIAFDDELPATEGFTISEPINIDLQSGKNLIRFMNHRRQENTLNSYATIREEFTKAAPDSDIVISLCEWGKTQPHRWGYKIGDSWRILNDITFQVGSDGDPGQGAWTSDYTTSITSQYNKAVIMDEFAGLNRGWNDPDMLMIGMNGLDDTMCRTHMSMWCMMNSPLMLGLDLRRVNIGDVWYNIISNKDVIALNQDKLGIQAKRIDIIPQDYSANKDIWDKAMTNPDKEYVRDNDRIDILAKPLSDGSIAVAFYNLSEKDLISTIAVDIEKIVSAIGDKMVDIKLFKDAQSYEITNLWTGEKYECGCSIEACELAAHADMTVRVKAK